VATDYLNLLATKGEPKAALAELEYRTSWYDQSVVCSLARVLQVQEPHGEATRILEVSVKELRLGQVLQDNIETATGLLLVPAGTRLGLSHLEKLRNHARLSGIREPISVLSRG
jgi:hypothetical protein